MKLEQRPDGWYLIGDLGEEVGPFTNESDAMEFLKYVEELQKKKADDQ
jgi:hypothetical protein